MRRWKLVVEHTNYQLWEGDKVLLQYFPGTMRAHKKAAKTMARIEKVPELEAKIIELEKDIAELQEHINFWNRRNGRQTQKSLEKRAD